MFKNKKVVAIVMATMLGISRIGGSMVRNDVGAIPITNGEYVLPDDYEVTDGEQHYLDQLRNNAISDINEQIYDLDDAEEDFSGGCTLLMMAAYEGWLKLAKELLERGADVTLVNNGNRNAVMLASWAQNIEMLNLLHRLRADDVEANINAVNNGPDTALTEALVMSADLEIVSLLVSWGADVTLDVANGEWHSNTIGAAIQGECDVNVIEFLLNNGASPDGKYGNEDDLLPLEVAFNTYNGSDKYTVMQLLLRARVNTATHDYSDLLGKAIVRREDEISNLLRSFGVNNPSSERLAELQQD